MLTGIVNVDIPTPNPVITLPAKAISVEWAKAIVIQPATNSNEHNITLNFLPNFSIVYKPQRPPMIAPRGKTDLHKKRHFIVQTLRKTCI